MAQCPLICVLFQSQYTLDNGTLKKPSIKAEKDFIFSKGKLGLECGTEKEVFYHGQEIPINIAIKNGGNKSVKLIELSIIQHCEMTMVCQKHRLLFLRKEQKSFLSKSSKIAAFGTQKMTANLDVSL